MRCAAHLSQSCSVRSLCLAKARHWRASARVSQREMRTVRRLCAGSRRRLLEDILVRFDGSVALLCPLDGLAEQPPALEGIELALRLVDIAL